MACAPTHPKAGPSYRLLKAGSWSANITASVQGGQGMHFIVTNTNVLGTTLTIKADTGEKHSALIPPVTTDDTNFNFSIFSPEPRTWGFEISTDSDAFVVTWCLYSTWIPGDPSNLLPPESVSETDRGYEQTATNGS